jgi:hypothetical protein
MEAAYDVAGIDVHKKMLAVVVANARDRELHFECRRFGTTVQRTTESIGMVAAARGAGKWSWSRRRSTGNRCGWRWKDSFSSGWHKHGGTEAPADGRPTFAMRNAV